MQTPEARRLAEIMLRKVEDFKGTCQGLDEETASRAPSGRWTPKEIVSHVCGPEGIGMLPTFQAFIEEDTPRLDIEPENSFFSDKRAQMTLAELLEEFEREYDSIVELVAGLSEGQLNRKAHIPLLKESPFGEYPTLADWVSAIGEYHLGMHTDHMREILEALGAASRPRGDSMSTEAQQLHQ